MKFLIIDNYDSFVYNIAQYLGELGVESDVIRNDKITLDEIKQNNYDAITSPSSAAVAVTSSISGIIVLSPTKL